MMESLALFKKGDRVKIIGGKWKGEIAYIVFGVQGGRTGNYVLRLAAHPENVVLTSHEIAPCEDMDNGEFKIPSAPFRKRKDLQSDQARTNKRQATEVRMRQITQA
jgi:hypothetical protein